MGITVGVDKLVTRHFFFSLSLLFILLLFPLVSGTRTVGRVFFNFISTGIFMVVSTIT